MTTVGFGDLTGRTSNEYIFSMVLEMYGVIIGSLLLVVCTQFIISLQQLDQASVLSWKLQYLDVWTKKLERSNIGYYLPAEVYLDCHKFIREAFEKDNNMILEQFSFY